MRIIDEAQRNKDAKKAFDEAKRIHNAMQKRESEEHKKELQELKRRERGMVKQQEALHARITVSQRKCSAADHSAFEARIHSTAKWAKAEELAKEEAARLANAAKAKISAYFGGKQASCQLPASELDIASLAPAAHKTATDAAAAAARLETTLSDLSSAHAALQAQYTESDQELQKIKDAILIQEILLRKVKPDDVRLAPGLGASSSSATTQSVRINVGDVCVGVADSGELPIEDIDEYDPLAPLPCLF